MKKITILLFLVLIFGCSTDQDNSESGDGQGGSLAIFALKGNYLYGVDNSKLNVFSLLNPSTPVSVNEVEVGFDIETLFSFEDYLFIGSRNGMFIYSIENPENPVLLSQAQHFTSCDPVVANATNAFVTLHSGTFCGNNLNVLQVYNTTDVNNPILIHSRNLTYPKGLSLYNDYLFVCDDVIKIFDIQNPAEPILVNTINKECFDIIINNNTFYAIGNYGLYRYELNPNNINDIQYKSEVVF
ncbi:MAG TPA: hypothetical protein PLH25_07355 [Flavobacterium sp.]|nr:hypothetical protein [Flavobacterium sp.]